MIMMMIILMQVDIGGAPSSMDASCEEGLTRVLRKVCETIDRNEARLADQERRERLCSVWQQMALVSDRLLLLAFTGLTVTVSLVV